jgi:two-component system, NarL family, sensor histidine kinase DegS
VLYAEAKGAIGYATNQLRAITELYRETHRLELRAWHRDRDELARMDRDAVRLDDEAVPAEAASGEDRSAIPEAAAEAAAAGAVRHELRRAVDMTGSHLADQQRDLSRLELVTRSFENAWLFLERDDASLTLEDGVPLSAADLRMRVVEAQERERVRLAQEIHDGPAQMIANAFFQVDYVQRLMERDPRLAATELRFLREVMRRELADIRSFIGQLRPPALEEIGLDGAIREAIATFASSVEVRTETLLDAPAGALSEMQQVVVLRVLQEALQNTRKHANAHLVSISTSTTADGWTLEVRDDGRGFDVDAIGARGRHNFGLQFMRERAELVGGSIVVRSSPGAGTVVRLSIEGEGQPG